MNKKDTRLIDKHLPLLSELRDVETDPSFYTRLTARMEKEQDKAGWSLPVKPVWVIGTLLLLLALNFFTLFGKNNTRSSASQSSGLSDFASSYDQTISSNIQ